MGQAVVGIITKDQNGQPTYLLVSAVKDFGAFTGYYYPPGGHLEAGETEEQALIRELREELSLDVKPLHRITSTPADIADEEIAWWECEVSGDMKLDSELRDARYFTEAEIKNG